MTYVVGVTVVLDAGGISRTTLSMSRLGTDSLWDVVARLTPVAAAAFARQTSEHLGDTIAVLVDDRIVAIGVINGALGSVAPVILNAPRAIAEALAARINQFILESHRVP